MVKNSNVRIMLDRTDISQDVKHVCGMKTENYEFIIDRLENQESRLKYVLRKIDQVKKKC